MSFYETAEVIYCAMISTYLASIYYLAVTLVDMLAVNPPLNTHYCISSKPRAHPCATC